MSLKEDIDTKPVLLIFIAVAGLIELLVASRQRTDPLERLQSTVLANIRDRGVFVHECGELPLRFTHRLVGRFRCFLLEPLE